jgi:hypothetical protein
LKEKIIHHVPRTEWETNIVLVTKKRGPIHVSIDFWDLNKAHPKDNYSTPFIDYIIDECVKNEI